MATIDITVEVTGLSQVDADRLADSLARVVRSITGDWFVKGWLSNPEVTYEVRDAL